MRLTILLGLAALASACGGSRAPAERAPTSEASVADVAPSRPPQREGTIARAELDAVLEAGFGRFLQSVSTEAHVEDGHFVGFRLTELRGYFFEGVDLRPGDTLLSVNGQAIERPEEALQVWSGLRVASELTVEFLRDGERHQLRFGISD